MSAPHASVVGQLADQVFDRGLALVPGEGVAVGAALVGLVEAEEVAHPAASASSLAISSRAGRPTSIPVAKQSGQSTAGEPSHHPVPSQPMQQGPCSRNSTTLTSSSGTHPPCIPPKTRRKSS